MKKKISAKDLEDWNKFINSTEKVYQKDKNQNPKVIVGRLNDEYKHTIPTAVQFAKKQIGVDYDEIFILNNDKYYCSELIYEAFAKDSIFQLKPMTFLTQKVMILYKLG